MTKVVIVRCVKCNFQLEGYNAMAQGWVLNGRYNTGICGWCRDDDSQPLRVSGRTIEKAIQGNLSK